jgi:hypothetical protein
MAPPWQYHGNNMARTCRALAMPLLALFSPWSCQILAMLLPCSHHDDDVAVLLPYVLAMRLSSWRGHGKISMTMSIQELGTDVSRARRDHGTIM